jgi:hypothetical protein
MTGAFGVGRDARREVVRRFPAEATIVDIRLGAQRASQREQSRGSWSSWPAQSKLACSVEG